MQSLVNLKKHSVKSIDNQAGPFGLPDVPLIGCVFITHALGRVLRIPPVLQAQARQLSTTSSLIGDEIAPCGFATPPCSCVVYEGVAYGIYNPIRVRPELQEHWGWFP